MSYTYLGWQVRYKDARLSGFFKDYSSCYEALLHIVYKSDFRFGEDDMISNVKVFYSLPKDFQEVSIVEVADLGCGGLLFPHCYTFKKKNVLGYSAHYFRGKIYA